MWKLKTLPKIHHFLWCILHGALAVAERLRSRSLNVDVACKACGQGPESICHVLFHCPTASEVWRLAQIDHLASGFFTTLFLKLSLPHGWS